MNDRIVNSYTVRKRILPEKVISNDTIVEQNCCIPLAQQIARLMLAGVQARINKAELYDSIINGKTLDDEESEKLPLNPYRRGKIDLADMAEIVRRGDEIVAKIRAREAEKRKDIDVSPVVEPSKAVADTGKGEPGGINE